MLYFCKYITIRFCVSALLMLHMTTNVSFPTIPWTYDNCYITIWRTQLQQKSRECCKPGTANITHVIIIWSSFQLVIFVICIQQEWDLNLSLLITKQLLFPQCQLNLMKSPNLSYIFFTCLKPPLLSCLVHSLLKKIVFRVSYVSRGYRVGISSTTIPVCQF